ncbi:MAG: DUF2974 domain-containing protein [Legionellaceae bacterium]|nr:DUF2974 domain-containing protein [Legionellaceae bacterium]
MPSDKTSVCDVELLLNASQAAYRIAEDGTIDDDAAHVADSAKQGDGFLHTNRTISQKGYRVLETIDNTATTGLNAVCLEPLDDEGPIVVAFRGTKTAKDWSANKSIAKKGRVGDALYADAYQTYEQARNRFPGREIVLTGHSMAGNLVQDVLLTAYEKGAEQGHSLMGRTFNTAPAHTPEGEYIEKNHPEVLDNLANYRTSTDMVSDIPFYKGYGDFYSFPCSKSRLRMASHLLYTMNNELSEDVKQLQVGSATTENAPNAREARMIERMTCMQNAYEARVKKQLFSNLRTGAGNLKAFQCYLGDISKAIKDKDYGHANGLLEALQSNVRGRVSEQFVNELKDELAALNTESLDVSSINTEGQAVLLDNTKADLCRRIKEDYTQVIDKSIGGALGDTPDEPDNTVDDEHGPGLR